jgi:DNA gyrase subunit A
VADDARVIAFALVDPQEESNRVVTIARGENFYGDPVSSIKVSDFADFPTKGRATGGVRAHRFLTGESELVLGFVGPHPQAASAGGAARSLPESLARRDASGVPLEQKIDAIGTVPYAGGAEAAAGSAAAAPATGAGTPTDGASGEDAAAAEAEAARKEALREEIARTRPDDDGDAVIVSHDEEDDGPALF